MEPVTQEKQNAFAEAAIEIIPLDISLEDSMLLAKTVALFAPDVIRKCETCGFEGDAEVLNSTGYRWAEALDSNGDVVVEWKHTTS